MGFDCYNATTPDDRCEGSVGSEWRNARRNGPWQNTWGLDVVLQVQSMHGGVRCRTGSSSEFPVIFDGTMPDFTPEGSLPPGDFRPSAVEFESRFVRHGDSAKRNAIYQGWQRHRDALMRSGLPARSRQLLDGSFTTAKPSPGDIDIAVEFPTDAPTLVSMTDAHPTLRLLQGPDMKASFHCDAYPIFVLPASDPMYSKSDG